MNNTINKLLKAELFFLFILTLLSLAAFYYGDSLPDNYLSISSTSDSIGSFSYLYSSIIVFVGYYLGPWTLFPFICFAVFYTLKFSKRSYPFDLFNILTLSIGTLFIFYFFSPNFLGSGVNFILKKYFGLWEGLSIGVLFLIAFFAGSFRSSFKEAAIQFFSFLGRLPGQTWRFFLAVNPVRLYQNTVAKYQAFKGKLQVKLPSALKGDSDRKKLGAVVKNARPNLSLKERMSARREEKTVEIEEVQFTPKVASSNAEESVTMSPLGGDDQKTSLSSAFEQKEEPSEKEDAIKSYKLKSEQRNEKQYYDIVTTLTDVRGKRDQSHPDDEYFERIIQSIQGLSLIHI